MSLLKEIKKIFVNTCVEKISINKINKNDKTILLLRTDLIGDYLVTRVFLELIRKSKKFKDYKTVVLLNSAVKDLALEFDSKYADEFIFYDIRYSSPKTIKFLGESLSKYNFEYLINYHTLRHILPDEIAGAIKAKNKFALSNFALNLPDEKKDFYNKNYTKIFTASPDYFFGSVQFANLVTGENYSEHSATSCFGINETNFPEDKKLNFNYPYVILFPSASNTQKRMGFVHFLNIAKYVYETIKDKTGKEIKCVLLGSKKDSDILLSIHQNSLPNPKDIDKKYGVGTYYYHPQAKSLAQKIQQNLVSDTKFRDDKVNYASFAITRASLPVSVLIECGYIIRKEEAEKISDKKFQKIIAKAITNGCKQYLKENF